MAAEVSNFAVSDVLPPLAWEMAPEPITLYSREALRAETDTVRAERWLLPSAGQRYWRCVQRLGRGLLSPAEFDDPYVMCFVPLPEGHEMVHTSVGSYPLIGGPQLFDHRKVQRSNHGLVMNILMPCFALNEAE